MTTVFLLTGQEIFAQGPPINTDTPIMLGVQGRGIRTFGKIIRKATLLKDGSEITDPMDRQVTVFVTPFAVPYNLLNDKLQLGVIVPFMNIDVNSNGGDISSSGIGDLRLFAKYLLYQYDRKNKTVRVAAKAGVKLPSGDEDEQPPLGTGSTDYFFTTVAGWIEGRVGVYLEGIYNVNTSKAAVDFGNSVSYNFAFGYRLLPAVYETYPSPQLNGFLEINGTTTNKNTVNEQKVNDSGGTTIFLSPGLQYVGGRRWLIEASVQIPIVNEPNGTQLGTDWTVSLGTRVLLF
ncbi:MAG: transporter, partial [Calditrichaeota bacterium]